MFKVNSFLGCCSLETGGKIIGLFHAIGTFIALIVSIIYFLFAVFFSVAIEAGIHESNKHDDYNDAGGFKAFGHAVAGILIFIAIFVFIFALVCFVASIKLLNGISERNHLKMTFFLTLMKIFFVIDFLGFLGLIGNNAPNDKITGALVSLCIHIYCVIVISSLYDKIQMDSMPKIFNNPLTAHVVQMPPPYVQYSSQTHPYANNGTTMPYENKI